MSNTIQQLQNSQGTPGMAPVNSGTKLGKDEFMKLLMAQLKAQDPLNPMDSTAFVAQLSQFASLEQQTAQTKRLDDLITITGANNSATSVSLLGKEVRLQSNQIQGNQSVYYELAAQASSCQVEIRDQSGAVIQTYSEQPTTTGLHEVKIKDLPKGNYNVIVTAKGVDNKPIQSDVSVGDIVNGVNFAGNVPTLLLGSGGQMPANLVVEIRNIQAGQGN